MYRASFGGHLHKSETKHGRMLVRRLRGPQYHCQPGERAPESPDLWIAVESSPMEKFPAPTGSRSVHSLTSSPLIQKPPMDKLPSLGSVRGRFHFGRFFSN